MPVLAALLRGLLLLLCAAPAAPAAATTLLLVCPPSNDVLRLLSASAAAQPFALRHFTDLGAALAAAQPGSALLALTDGTLGAGAALALTPALYAALAAANLTGAYLEMPSLLPGGASGDAYAPTPAWYFDRVTAVGQALAPFGLARLQLLQAQGAYFQAYPPEQLVPRAVLAYAHVAGMDSAVYGLPPPPSLNPVLFRSPNASASLLLGAISLSCLRACRYTPVARWVAVWNYLLDAVLGAGGSYAAFPAWEPLVRASGAASAAALPPAALGLAARRATDWLAAGSGLLVVGDGSSCPAPHAPVGAAVMCMLEGFSSRMAANGSQALAGDARTDCSAESAMALALRAAAEARNASSGASGAAAEFAFAAAALLNYTWLHSSAAQAHDNASAGDFGLLAWGVSGDWAVCSYGDDNARSVLGTLAAAKALAGLPSGAPAPQLQRAWLAMALKSILGNLRLASARGFRPGRVNYADVAASGGWRRFHYSGAGYANTSFPQPHYQAQMWAVFLAAYAQTAFEPLYAAALRGLEDTMAHYAAAGSGGRWRWTEYASEEQGRLLLPLAWLLRADALRGSSGAGGAPPNATHLAWLHSVADDYLARQHAGSGAVLEALGPAGQCDACPPASNAAYGSGEAPLIDATGEPIADLLYGSNFGLVSVVEAWRATGEDARFALPAARLASFLASAQLQSAAFPQLDGAWMRGFNVQSWEPGGAAADSGWGPWSVETGWSATWAAAGLYSVAGGGSVWDMVTGSGGSSAGVLDAQLLAQWCGVFFEGTEVACPA
jgi:hypothetical protein